MSESEARCEGEALDQTLQLCKTELEQNIFKRAMTQTQIIIIKNWTYLSQDGSHFWQFPIDQHSNGNWSCKGQKRYSHFAIRNN